MRGNEGRIGDCGEIGMRNGYIREEEMGEEMRGGLCVKGG